ncbi:SDR family NAD(P)-dependent oxidoreductase, partial [Candidatus Falkowbacteria bacterium]|nr:SDR family NAD(P)-dependent oxidoreductase [Candidatus Falkowbacteria bacterium]
VLSLDIPASNTRIDPWTGAAPQPAYAAATRITASLAPGLPGSPDLTAVMTSEIVSFFGAATPAQFAVSGETVRWNGPASDRGLRRLVLHYAHIAARAGGGDSFLLGPRLDGLVTLRSGPGSYPATAQWVSLAAAVRQILGAATKIGFSAGPVTWHSHHPAPGEVRFPLDTLWADANVDFIGVEASWPLADWRDGDDHLDAALWPAPQDRSYLVANVTGGEGYDWRYLSDGDRASQRRTPVLDLAVGIAAEAWLYRPKDIVSWWSNAHVPRVGGMAQTPTAWIPRSKPIRFTALGAPAVDRAANEPDALRTPLAADARLPWFSRGWRDDASQRSVIEALLGHWSAPGVNPVSPQTGAPMLDVANSAASFWDTRPYPAYPEATDLWPDATTWRTGHTLSGRLGSVSLAALVRLLCRRAGLADEQIDVSGLWGAVEGHVITALESPRTSITVLARHFGFDAVESEGRIRFLMRGRAPAAKILADNMVTGASGGIGLAAAEKLAVAGCDLALQYHAHADQLSAFQERCRKAGASVRLFEADLLQSGASAKLIQQVLDAFGQIDILVCCAG